MCGRLLHTLLAFIIYAVGIPVWAETPEPPVIPIGQATVEDLLNNLDSVVAIPATIPQQIQQQPKEKTEKPKAPEVSTLPPKGYVPADHKTPIPQNKLMSKAERLYRQAIKQRSSAPAEARQQLEQVLAINPAHKSARLALGSLLTKSAQTGQATRVLQPLLYQSNPDWRPWFWYGTALLQQGELNQAGQILDQALIRERGIPAIWVQRAIVEQERGSAENALKLLNAAARISTGQPSVMLNIAVAANAIDGMNGKTEAYYDNYKMLKKITE